MGGHFVASGTNFGASTSVPVQHRNASYGGSFGNCHLGPNYYLNQSSNGNVGIQFPNFQQLPQPHQQNSNQSSHQNQHFYRNQHISNNQSSDCHVPVTSASLNANVGHSNLSRGNVGSFGPNGYGAPVQPRADVEANYQAQSGGRCGNLGLEGTNNANSHLHNEVVAPDYNNQVVGPDDNVGNNVVGEFFDIVIVIDI